MVDAIALAEVLDGDDRLAHVGKVSGDRQQNIRAYVVFRP
jgi:hypothetical protein